MDSILTHANPYYPNVLFYIPALNRFMDHDWIIVHDLHALFDTWQIDAWVGNRRNELMRTKSGSDMMLYFLATEEEDEVFDYLLMSEDLGLQVDRMRY